MVNCLISRLISTMSNTILCANTLIVNDRLTPNEVGIIDPSVTYNRSYFSLPVLSLCSYKTIHYGSNANENKSKIDVSTPLIKSARGEAVLMSELKKALSNKAIEVF